MNPENEGITIARRSGMNPENPLSKSPLLPRNTKLIFLLLLLCLPRDLNMQIQVQGNRGSNLVGSIEIKFEKP